jgi:hypothetical protein
MQSEPATSEKNVDLAQGMLASSHRFAQSAITLEAALYTPTELVVPEGLEKFVQDVDATLEALSAALRLPSPSLGGKLTDLRADQTAMVASLESSGRMGTALLPETERMTNSLNTMVDLVRRCAAEPAAPPSEPSTAREVKHSA